MAYNILSMRKDGSSISRIRDTIRRNLSSRQHARFSYQYSSPTAEQIRRRAAALSHLGDLIGQAIRDDDSSNAIDALNDHRSYISEGDWVDRLQEIFGGDYFSCYDCGEIGYYDDSRNYRDEYRICECCTDNYYWSDRNDRYQDDEDEDQDDYQDGYSNIGSYHSSRRKLGHIASSYDKRKPRVLVGLELEMEISSSYDLDDKAGEVLDALSHTQDINGRMQPYCLLEQDGSISNGFELVSGYTGLDIHARQLQFFKNKLPGAKSHNTTTCGLHVHICKADMSMLQAAKMILFINDPQNYDLVKCLARRDASGYAKFQNKKEDKTWLRDAMRYSSEKDRQLRNINSDRYEALNFQNEKTIEFRLFRGTLKYETIMACLEFAWITWFFCRDTSQAQLTTDNFLKYICLENNRRDTKFLRAYLISKNYQLPFHAKAAAAAEQINQEEI